MNSQAKSDGSLDYTDLIARLRSRVSVLDVDEAADALEAQARRIAELRKEADMMHSEYKTAAARIAEEEEKGREREEYIALCQIRIEELKAALAPFVDAAHFKITARTGTVIENTVWEICVSEAALRAAHAAYRGEKE